MSGTEPGEAVTLSQRILAPNAASGEGASGGIDTPPTQRHQTRPDLPLLVGLVRCPAVSGQGIRIGFSWKGTGTDAGKRETILCRV
jgi:hypothetical protein